LILSSAPVQERVNPADVWSGEVMTICREDKTTLLPLGAR
jgi:hypothetical protein